VYGFVRVASLLAATVAVFARGPGALAQLRPDDVVLLAGALGVIAVLAVLRPPNAHFEQSPRPTPDSDRAGLVVPVLLVVLVQTGWFWAAVCNVLTELVRPVRTRRRPVFQRILSASLRAPGWMAGILIEAPLRARVALPASPLAMGAFVLIATAFVLLVDLLWIDPLAALRQHRSLLRIWTRHLTDLATLTTILVEAVWAYVVVRIAAAEGAFLALTALLPLIVLAIVLVRFARVNARLHRLALSRDAVDAMLRASDPRPQMRSLLESIDARMTREAIEVAAFGRGGADRWSRVVQFGPPIPFELQRLGARVLVEVQATGNDTAIEHSDDGSVRAFAARDVEGLRGALVVFRRAGASAYVGTREFERAAAEIAPLLGEYGAIAASHSAASIDPLTGLPNRRGVARALEQAMEHVRAGGRYAVLLLDVDHFKSINDLLGHQTGDRALAKIGRTIAENIRAVDVAGRFGGEEFLVLLRDASRERTMQVAERLRSAVEASGLPYADGKPVTISIGVAYARPVDGPSDIVERADRALYRAKHAGRNRVVESPLVAF
jgi:diguanylate cyclase (GGDEF)-like protein